MNQSLSLALPEIVVAAAGLVLLMLGVFRRGDSTRLVAWLVVAVLILATVLVWVAPTATGHAFGGLFVTDSYAGFVKVLVLLAAAAAMVMSLGYIEREQMARFEFPVLLLFSTLGMMLMISANDLISLYVGLELQSLALYVVAAFRRDTIRSTEAGLKYFVLGALSSGMLLYGSSLIYGFAGTTKFDGIATLLAGLNGTAPSLGLIVGLVFLIAGLAFKVSAVPFHMWTPDVYEGSPTPVTAFFAMAPKVAAIGLFGRVLVGPFGGMVGDWQQIVSFIAFASMAFGAVAAINQNNIKRLMAYSSIANVGYALVGLAAGTAEGVSGMLIYMALYVVMNAGTFAVILAMRQQGRMVEGITDLAGLGKTRPMMAASLAIFMFSLAGIPPLAGFFGKLFVFRAAINAGLYWLAVLGVLASVVGAFYYLRIIKVMYFDEPREGFDKPMEWELAGILTVSAVIILLFFIVPSSLLVGADSAAAALFHG
ncbi:NADH-quinone oxidoreductase subunit N [Hypericibacter adhaerens]|jgi:NADH-quinone oxidoreductase subunit N|uniref:NADH-quinone oxidoreductase subunit N n=1 Tax=Hypericibacter adhaerens TaxID=2602016 RepID=A0A5J6N5W5_9PROT|nr:NADH-quinone oxidoreductase subunit NuoN [Hypericibacter adhaerens]QEX22356.1 NADH-quinone oxidoreductase subunit N [Hypericibacter adhaerens]